MKQEGSMRFERYLERRRLTARAWIRNNNITDFNMLQEAINDSGASVSQHMLELLKEEVNQYSKLKHDSELDVECIATADDVALEQEPDSLPKRRPSKKLRNGGV